MLLSSKWLLGLCLYIAGCHNNQAGRSIGGPPFTKEGEVYFLSKVNNDTLRKIDVELATTNQERAQGLMNRKSMTDEQGMLFIFPAASEQSFWMKNTYISLDIIFIDDHKEVVSVQRNTTPLSEESLPSFKDAQYVVEVNAGFFDKYHISYGDKVAYKQQK